MDFQTWDKIDYRVRQTSKFKPAQVKPVSLEPLSFLVLGHSSNVEVAGLV